MRNKRSTGLGGVPKNLKVLKMLNKNFVTCQFPHIDHLLFLVLLTRLSRFGKLGLILNLKGLAGNLLKF